MAFCARSTALPTGAAARGVGASVVSGPTAAVGVAGAGSRTASSGSAAWAAAGAAGASSL